MKNAKLIFILTVVMFISVLFYKIAQAGYPSSWDEQEDEEETRKEMDSDLQMASEEISGTAKGKVTMVSDASDAVWLQTEDKYGDPCVSTYYTNSASTFTGIRSLTDLNEGDIITIDYFVMKDKNIIDGVVLQKRIFKDDPTEAQTGKDGTFIDKGDGSKQFQTNATGIFVD